MKRIKETVIFCIIFLIIVLLDFAIYRNIDMFLLKDEGEIYTFANDSKNEQKDFLSEMFEMAEMQNNYKQTIDFEDIRNNDILYNLIRNNIYGEYEDKYMEITMNSNSYICELSNTIYGDFKALNINADSLYGPDYLIIYSEDMKKFYYLDLEQRLSTLEATNVSIYDTEEKKLYKIKQGIVEDDAESSVKEKIIGGKSRDELVNSTEKLFSELMKNYEFEPDTIMYEVNYYILKDSIRDITIYYNATIDAIFGFYIGFNK